MKLLQKLILLISIANLISCTSCDENETNYFSSCDFECIVDPDIYENSESSNVTISNLEIIDNCLTINYSSSGCDGSTWEVRLIANDEVLESNPPQRNLKFELTNQEACLAVISKSSSFDILNLQVEGSTSVYLNLDGYDNSILYEY
ncbi:hypothetical protein [Mesonia sp.]|uniref:hypothetical protein n=1 Tax=Mesonia sp. TaxID=1960830 RepID=UPI0017761DC5|nr:hypothetical protein [Mesonia sp.]HIB38132.1 hypothetical protein [Mesonia sp.]